MTDRLDATRRKEYTMVKIQQRTAYHAETRGRSYFTIKAALTQECFAQIREKRCECEPESDSDRETGSPSSQTCAYHSFPEDGGPSLGQLVANRFAKLYKSRFRVSRKDDR